MTVLEVIQRSTEFLAAKGVESPRLHAELLLAHALKLPRLKLYLNFERALLDAEVEAMRALVRRRATREPLQHIVGSTSFCGFEIAVNRHVLVPRPETELLAERALAVLSTANSSGAPLIVLDFGTGSGCIAIVLAAKASPAQVHALDVSADALAVARENAAQNRVADRIQFWQGEGFKALPSGAKFDLIVSNPPYIPSAEIATLAPEVRDFDPRLALDGGADGLDFHRQIAERAAAFLRPGGRLMIEFGDEQETAVQLRFARHGWLVEAVEPDFSGRPRIMVARPAQS